MKIRENSVISVSIQLDQGEPERGYEMAWYCEKCGREVARENVTTGNLHDEDRDGCGKEVYEIEDTNFAAWGETGYPDGETE